MTSITLAQSYLLKATKRLPTLDVLLDGQAFSDVVRESQEIVELALKGMLRHVGVEPPKQHDVGALLIQHANRFPPGMQADLPPLADASKWLRKEREFSFYGEDDFVPTEEYSKDDALRAMSAAQDAVAAATRVIPSP